MSEDKPKLDLRSLVDNLLVRLQAAKRYSFVIFIVVVGLLYGFLLLRISTLSSAQPTQDAIDKQVKSSQLPHIDQSVVDQLESLQNNNAGVKTIFNDARSNPFQ